LNTAGGQIGPPLFNAMPSKNTLETFQVQGSRGVSSRSPAKTEIMHGEQTQVQGRLVNRLHRTGHKIRGWDRQKRRAIVPKPIFRGYAFARRFTDRQRLVKTVVESAAWKGGVLHTTLFGPFQILRHSNRESDRKESENVGSGRDLEIWLPGMDSNHD
jgi:hypothetical protein